MLQLSSSQFNPVAALSIALMPAWICVCACIDELLRTLMTHAGFTVPRCHNNMNFSSVLWNNCVFTLKRKTHTKERINNFSRKWRKMLPFCKDSYLSNHFSKLYLSKKHFFFMKQSGIPIEGGRELGIWSCIKCTSGDYVNVIFGMFPSGKNLKDILPII